MLVMQRAYQPCAVIWRVTPDGGKVCYNLPTIYLLLTCFLLCRQGGEVHVTVGSSGPPPSLPPPPPPPLPILPVSVPQQQGPHSALPDTVTVVARGDRNVIFITGHVTVIHTSHITVIWKSHMTVIQTNHVTVIQTNHVTVIQTNHVSHTDKSCDSHTDKSCDSHTDKSCESYRQIM